ncbi:MAG: YeeE/YedE family protein, partial [Geminicoccaceae bacterium]
MAATETRSLPELQWPVALAGLGILIAGTLFLGSDSWHLAALLVIGALLSMSLYHAAFGFTSASRNAIVHRE